MEQYTSICYVTNDSLTLTGSVPGNAASKGDTRLLIGAANSTAEPENSFELAKIRAWISKPMTGSQWLQKAQNELHDDLNYTLVLVVAISVQTALMKILLPETSTPCTDTNSIISAPAMIKILKLTLPWSLWGNKLLKLQDYGRLITGLPLSSHDQIPWLYPDFSRHFKGTSLIIDPLNSSDINKCTHFSLPHSYILTYLWQLYYPIQAATARRGSLLVFQPVSLRARHCQPSKSSHSDSHQPSP